MASFQRDIALRLDGLRGAAASRALAAFAAEQRDRVVAEAPAKPTGIDTVVDGRRGAVLESVRPDGTILFRFHWLDAVVDDAVGLLVRQAPYLSSHHNGLPYYRDAFAMFVDGQKVDIRTKVPAGAEIVLTNLLPFARKIERGSSLMAPDGVFQVVAGLLKRRWAGAAQISYGWRIFPGAGPGGPAGRRGAGRSRQHDDSFASITIKARAL